MNLPQFSRRQILVLSAHQIVIGKELEVLAWVIFKPSSFTYRLVKRLASGKHIVFYQLAHNLVREWTAIAGDDVEAVLLCTLSVVVWIFRRSDAVSDTEADVDARIRTSATR